MVPSPPHPGNDLPPQFRTIAAGSAHARVEATLAAALTDLLAVDVADWTTRGFTMVKQRTVRLVLRGQVGGVDCHVKVYRTHSLADRARDALRGPRGEREFIELLKLRTAGWPVVAPLACGVLRDRDASSSFLVTGTLVDAHPFAWPASSAAATGTGRLLRRLHDAGLRPADLHPGNVLLTDNGQPCLIDVVGMARGDPPTLRHRAVGLAFFCQDLDGGALDPLATALLHGYLEAGTPPLPDLTAELAAATRRLRARALQAFGRRSSRDCRHTELTQRQRGAPHWTWRRSCAADHTAVREACTLLVDAGPQALQTGRRGGVHVGERVVAKRRSRALARQLWRAAYWLDFAKVASPEPVGLCLLRDAGIVCSRRVPGSTLAELLTQRTLPPTAVTPLARQLGTQVGRLHGHNLRNRDLKFDNLMVAPDHQHLWIVDLDGVQRNGAGDWRGAGADLGRLLAAFRHHGAPGGKRTLRAFLGGWLRAQRQLLVRPPLRRIVTRALVRAGEWAAAHRPAGLDGLCSEETAPIRPTP